MKFTSGNVTINAGIEQGIGLGKALLLINEGSESTGIKDAGKIFNKLGLSSGKFRTSTVDTDFPVMYSIHGIDVWNETKSLLAAKTISNEDAIGIIVLFNEVIREISESESDFPPITPAQTADFINNYTDWATKVNLAVLESGNEQKLTGSQVKDLKQKFKAIQKNFAQSWKIYAKPGSPSIRNNIERIRNLLGQTQTNQEVYTLALEIGSVKIATTSFKNFRDKINRLIQKTWNGYSRALKPVKDSPIEEVPGLRAELQAQGVSSQIAGESITKIFNWGHTATQNTGGVRQILTPKILAQLISTRSLTNEQLNFINLDFQQQTGQINTVIKTSSTVTTSDEATVFELIINSGIFQSVLVQGGVYNRVVLGQQEKAYDIRERIRTDPKFRQALGIGGEDDFILKMANQRASPSFIERIVAVITNSITGEKPSSQIVGKKTTTNTKKQKFSIAAPKVTVNANRGRTPTVQKITTVSVQSQTPKLQELLDSLLVQTIKQNMGSGNRRDILNLRSGRFAESVQVERLSQSRQGAITAFYTYQKNPYATFSRGGKQERPYTRDPKLLISGSIRQLAQQLAISKIRAQLL